MTDAEGRHLSRLVLDAVALAEERVSHATLLAATLTLVIEGPDDEIQVVTASYPPADR